MCLEGGREALRVHQRPRILIFSVHFSELVLRFSAALTKHADVQVILLAENLQAEWGDLPLPRDVTVVTFRRKSLVQMVKILLRQLFYFRPSIVQFEETTSRWLFILIAISKIFSKVVLRVHDVVTHSGRDSKLSKFAFWGREWGRRNVDLVMLHGPYCSDQFSSKYLTPYFESAHGVIQIPEHEHRFEPHPDTLLMFGRMEGYKGLSVLIDAIEILEARGVRVRLTVAGRGPELANHSARIRRLQNVTVMDHFLHPREVTKILQESSVVVLPYTDATQSGVAAAAIGNHRPIIASRIGGLPESVRDGFNGILVNPGEPMELANAIARLLASYELQDRFSKGSKSLALGEYSWARIAEDVMLRLSVLIATARDANKSSRRAGDVKAKK